MYFYYDKAGVVAMISEGPLNKHGTLLEKKIKMTDKDIEKLKANYEVRLKKNKLEWKKPKKMEIKEKLQKNDLTIEDLKDIILDII